MGNPINFDAIPTQNPMGHYPEGFYKGVLKKIEVKQDTKKNEDYMVASFELFTVDDKKVGNFTDYFRNLETPALLYKLGRFIQALGLELKGTLDLRMVAKVIVVGKAVALELADNEWKEKISSQIKIFGSQCYWPITMLPGLVAAAAGGNIPEGTTFVPQPAVAAPVPAPAPAPDTTVYPFDAADGTVPPVITPQMYTTPERPPAGDVPNGGTGGDY